MKAAKDERLVDYFRRWINTYKRDAVRDVTLKKYFCTLRSLEELVPDLMLSQMDRAAYQDLMNRYAQTHEKQTVLDFHHHVKAVTLDAMDEGLIEADPTRRVVIKGKPPKEKKKKYLSRFELESLLRQLKLGDEPSFEWLILLIAKTGLRFSEALALTPGDFDFKKQRLTVNKTWNYKDKGGFTGTKNASSARTIQIDWQTAMQFYQLCEKLEPNKPIFVKDAKPIYNATVNDILVRYCEAAGVPVIGVHGLRHTHASLLLSAGVSVASVSQRLGHSNIATTQKVYLHVIKELDDKDTALIMTSLTGLGSQ